jgi:glycosyltransferase involved in cell wall biosynthesis
VERNPVAFGDAVAKVLRDPALAQRLGTAGRRAVETDWTWDRAVEGFDALLLRAALVAA